MKDRLPTLNERKSDKPNTVYFDRQNTVWAREIAHKCTHDWKPISMIVGENGYPNLTNARTYCICFNCHAHTYIETGYVGYFLGSPDDLEYSEAKLIDKRNKDNE